ncbi:DNA translocase FtsK [Rhizobium oryzicola]|uniref:DNA translocase FtsK n=1 Tax=Rhizobium oryzicola TaxID=1232668 RepID=A0ABT8SXB3_9HYPH|nr:DNA translocase FtsK [Rhizobium oryzicola]MDO1582935.1 DNA translocase FtsK [Rhizobium oryzicola]
MHFNRNNFNKTSDTSQTRDGTSHAQRNDHPAPLHAPDPQQVRAEQQAVWQSAFHLAPNVRFTRTPENNLARQKGRDVAPVAPEERVPAAAGRLVEPVDMEPAALRPGQDASQKMVEVLQDVASAMQQAAMAPIASVAPKPKPEPSPRALIVKRARPDLAARMVPPGAKMPEPAPPSEPAVTETPAAPEASLHSSSAQTKPTADIWLSDFAFFENGPVDLPAASAEPAIPAINAHYVTPAAEPAPVMLKRRLAEIIRQPLPDTATITVNSVTALYREVRPGMRLHRPVPVQIVAPVQPAPQVVPQPVAVVEATAPEVILPAAVEAPAPQAEVVAVAPEVTAQPALRVANVVPRRQPQGLPGLAGGLTPRQSDDAYEFPPISLLQEPFGQQAEAVQPDALQQSAGLLESILEDFGVKGEIIDVRPGPVVTLYEFEPAPGVKSSRVIGLADDIARSMSALSARVAVVPGRNVIGIELPNAVREMVFFRELIECEDYWETKHRLPLCLGKTIGGEPVIAELAKMPHLLVAGTTGSGKSVAINTMILSLLYRLRPEECRLIMIDPKMLELSVYDGIPHLLTPVVTDPKKAVLALKWAVREMEDRYRKMSRLGVRNIDGYNARAAQAREKGETITVSVQTGFDRNTGEIVYEDQELDLSPMPYIVVVVDEMADLMMVAGKEIEGAIQRLAQMARAAGIHLIMATQRPSVDVITGTIKANFPTRISFQVTSKIDSRTILGEQGAEHLLGQGDMLHMAGGGRIMRVHGPFVSDAEVEHVVTHLKAQGRPDYLGNVTEDEDEQEEDAPVDAAVFDRSGMGAEDSDDLYDKAVKVVMKDRKCSTSYIQRRLSIGYNRAASLVERMEKEGLVGPANHVGKREIISGRPAGAMPEEG